MWHKFLQFLTRQYIRRQLRRRPPQALDELHIDEVRRVLLINSTALGDLLFSTPVFRCLKKNFPAWEVDIVVQPGLKSLLQHNPDLHHCWNFPGRSLRLLKLAQTLRARSYEVVIILHGNDPEASLLAWLSGCPFIIGSSKSPFSFAYSYAVAPGPPDEHAIEKRLNFIRPLGVAIDDRHMAISLPASAKSQAETILTGHFGRVPTMLVAFHPGGSAPYKQWPPENFIKVGRFLQETYNAQFLLISTRAERHVAQSLAHGLEAPALVTGGDYDLLTVAALLSHCRLFLGNDSGPLHLALALRTPSIGILGADDPKRIGPHQADWGACIFKEEACRRNPCLTKDCPRSKCLEAVQPEEVIRLIREWWAPNFFHR